MALLLSLLMAGCGSVAMDSGNVSFAAAMDAEADTTTDLDLAIVQTNAPMVMRNSKDSRPVDTDVDVKYAITIENHTQEPIRVQRLDLRSLGASDAPIAVNMRKFNVTIDAGGKKTLDYWSTVTAKDPTLGSNVPTLVRVGVSFRAGDAERHEAFTRRVNGRASIGIHS